MKLRSIPVPLTAAALEQHNDLLKEAALVVDARKALTSAAFSVITSTTSSSGADRLDPPPPPPPPGAAAFKYKGLADPKTANDGLFWVEKKCMVTEVPVNGKREMDRAHCVPIGPGPHNRWGFALKVRFPSSHALSLFLSLLHEP